MAPRRVPAFPVAGERSWPWTPAIVSVVCLGMPAWLPAMALASCYLPGTFCCVDSQVDTTKLQMTRAAERVEIYSLRKGLPDNGDGLAAVYDEVPRDSWGNALLYVRIGDGFELVSLGEDGRPGGSGNDEDIFYSEVH